MKSKGSQTAPSTNKCVQKVHSIQDKHSKSVVLHTSSEYMNTNIKNTVPKMAVWEDAELTSPHN